LAKRSWSEEKRVLDTDVLPAWGDRSLMSITRADVRELVSAKAVQAPVMANRLLAHVSHLFNYALDLDLLDANPAARLKKVPTSSRERVLRKPELTSLWQYVDAGQVPEGKRSPQWSQTMRDAFAVLLLTGQRLGEVTRMTWADVDLKAAWWTIPATAAKNKRAHRVPLSKPVLKILEWRRPSEAGHEDADKYVFSTLAGTNVYRPIQKGDVRVRPGPGVERRSCARPSAHGCHEPRRAWRVAARHRGHQRRARLARDAESDTKSCWRSATTTRTGSGGSTGRRPTRRS
jgi:integrase